MKNSDEYFDDLLDRLNHENYIVNHYQNDYCYEIFIYPKQYEEYKVKIMHDLSAISIDKFVKDFIQVKIWRHSVCYMPLNEDNYYQSLKILFDLL